MQKTLTITPRINKFLEQASKTAREGNYIEIIEKALSSYINRKKRWLQIRQWGTASSKKGGISNMRQIEEIIDATRE